MVFSILWHNFKIVLELSNPFLYCESKPGVKTRGTELSKFGALNGSCKG